MSKHYDAIKTKMSDSEQINGWRQQYNDFNVFMNVYTH